MGSVFQVRMLNCSWVSDSVPLRNRCNGDMWSESCVGDVRQIRRDLTRIICSGLVEMCQLLINHSVLRREKPVETRNPPCTVNHPHQPRTECVTSRGFAKRRRCLPHVVSIVARQAACSPSSESSCSLPRRMMQQFLQPFAWNVVHCLTSSLPPRDAGG